MEDDEKLSCHSQEVAKLENIVTPGLLPEKSKKRYEQEYADFNSWCKSKKVQQFSEDVFLDYFSDKSKKYKSSSLWTYFSMLKCTLLRNDNINISKFDKLTAFLKRKSENHKPKKSKILSKNQIEQFIREAPDDIFLMTKVAIIIGIAGACRREELTYLSVDDIQDLGPALIVKLRETKTRTMRTFTVMNNNEDILGIYRKYAALRPQYTNHNRFFIYFKSGKCSIQPVGKNTFGSIPAKIAEYLKLPDYSQYTGHCLRRSSVTWFKNQYKSPTLGDDHVEDLVQNKLTNATLASTTQIKTSGESDGELSNEEQPDPEVCPKTVNVYIKTEFNPPVSNTFENNVQETNDNIKQLEFLNVNRQSTCSVKSNKVIETNEQEDNSLYNFFISVYNVTKVMPKHVQCKIKEKISAILKEEDLMKENSNSTTVLDDYNLSKRIKIEQPSLDEYSSSGNEPYSEFVQKFETFVEECDPL